ncbi:glycosyltransferase [Hydrogenophaga sp. PAMC20947]|uniref:glycosyltransferase n=1 Tax=Hydrogenophaga sp. PAMC20947 TaxID=2565558 RepID=UPI00109D9A17|nr:glycosyltransferase [Hydrogenophaga sp. PAMC20947]QCB46349.1 glycosyltransferase family 1 protein [Hydrogenophaga sp. PAMC20947]
MRTLKVLALQRESHVAPGVPSLSVAARITEVLDYLQQNGSLEYTSIAENNPASTNGVRWADVLILSKHSSPAALELVRLAKQSGKRIIYDIDDWIFSFPEYSGGKKPNVKTSLILEILSFCTEITVANQRLKERISGFIPECHHVPNGIWVEKYAAVLPKEPRPEEKRIVFTNADFLKLEASKELILTALQLFFMKHPEFVLDFYGDPFPEIVSLPFLHYTNRMPYDEYMQSLVSGQYLLSITPLGAAEDAKAAEFNACKNPFKYLNYGAAGVPGIYSKSPIYTDCVVHDETGWLVENTPKEWLGALETLAFDHSLRQRIRTQAYDDVSDRHHIKASAQALMTLLAPAVRGCR